MKETILMKYGEIILKGQNKYRFEELLIKNIKSTAAFFGKASIISSQSTIFVEFEDDDVDMDAATKALSKVFGISTLSRACKTEYDFETVKKTLADYFQKDLNKAKTFKVTAKRADKAYPFTSPQIAALLGEYVLEKFPHITVDLKNPDLNVYAEVREGNVYLHASPIKGGGGLPSGTSGHGMLMLSGGIDSPVAGFCMAKRGMKLSAIHFESPPYTSERAFLKVEKLAKKLALYASDINLYTVQFTKIQEAIKNECREDLFTIIMRRFMLRIACEVSRNSGAKAVITGESLGQVASQTVDAIACTDAVASLPVFRPLIGTDKQDIINIAYNIDSYNISIEPYEDCCTVFTPRHPKTTPRIDEVEKEEAKLDIESLIKSAEIKKTRIKA